MNGGLPTVGEKDGVTAAGTVGGCPFGAGPEAAGFTAGAAGAGAGAAGTAPGSAEATGPGGFGWASGLGGDAGAVLDDGDAGLAVEFDHIARDVLDDIGLDAFRGFLEQDQMRIRYQHTADRKLLLLATRHGAGALVPAFPEDRKRSERVAHHDRARGHAQPKSDDRGKQTALRQHLRERARSRAEPAWWARRTVTA